MSAAAPTAARASGFFPAWRPSASKQARATLDRGGSVLVIACCAARALIRLDLNPALYDAYPGDYVDARDPLNCARYYRVRARLPVACR